MVGRGNGRSEGVLLLLFLLEFFELIWNGNDGVNFFRPRGMGVWVYGLFIRDLFHESLG